MELSGVESSRGVSSSVVQCREWSRVELTVDSGRF